MTDAHTGDPIIGALRRVRFFSSAPERELAEISAALTPEEAPPGRTIFHRGDPGGSMYIILSGRVRVHSGDLVYNQLGAGDVFGEMAALDSAPRSASVTAAEHTRLLRLDQPALYALIERHAAVARGVIAVLCWHLRSRVHDQAEDFEYIRQVRQVAGAAQALERGVYRPEQIAEAAGRADELGDLARVFRHMASEVAARERRLQRQIEELRIEVDRGRQQRQVAEITGSTYFQHLQRQAARLREALRDEPGEDAGERLRDSALGG